MNQPAANATASGRHSRSMGRAISLGRRRSRDRVFVGLCVTVAAASTAVLLVLLGAIVYAGVRYLDLGFLTGFPSAYAERAAFMVPIMGSLVIMYVCALFALPIGVATAVLLEEYKPTKNPLLVKLHGLVQINITNLAGVPSIVYGILGYTAFYRFLDFGRSVLTGGLTLMLVSLPIVITSAREALRAVPDSLREATLAMGSTKWQMVSRTTLPAAIPGIMTGSILAMSRAIGEAAPVMIVSGAVFLTFRPVHLFDQFTAMPCQIFNWVSKPQQEFHDVAASGIIVLLVILLSFNVLAVIIRQTSQKDLA